MIGTISFGEIIVEVLNKEYEIFVGGIPSFY